MAAESKDLFAFRRGFTDLLPNRSLDYARDDSLVRNLKQLVKLQFALQPFHVFFLFPGVEKSKRMVYNKQNIIREVRHGV